jgi:hypothetical protein
MSSMRGIVGGGVLLDRVAHASLPRNPRAKILKHELRGVHTPTAETSARGHHQQTSETHRLPA